MSPERIAKHTPTFFHRRRRFGEIRDGDWDRYNTRDVSRDWLGTPIAEHGLYEAMKAHFEEGTDWLSTEFVQQQVETVAGGETAWYGKCPDRQSIHAQCRYLDRLYRSLETNGFDRHAEENSAWVFSDPYHEITVNVARDGELLFASDGRHRLFLSKLLGIERVPVRTLVIHREFVDGAADIDSLADVLHRTNRRSLQSPRGDPPTETRRDAD
ncbi:hypothetical protein [Haloarcula marina]|uniref:hypothetical protein n=1 Tax=Haloarcula marina TaxID=2961574 RepID=UPI0020B7C865|nr:hypothetical protein [Halomicroarcula marina]